MQHSAARSSILSGLGRNVVQDGPGFRGKKENARGGAEIFFAIAWQIGW